MTEPIDQATKTLIDEEADKYGFRVPYDGSNEFYDKSAVAGYIAGATVWAERLKQERNKVIDECIEILLDDLEDTYNTREEMREYSSTVKRMESIKDKDYVRKL